MTKLILSLLVITALLPITSLQAQDNSGEDDYDKIYQEDGIWYGVIEITDHMLSEDNCMYGKCSRSKISLSFSRDTEALQEITYDFITKDTCIGLNLFGLCIGSKYSGTEGTHTAYNKQEHGAFIDFLFQTNEIQTPVLSNYDYTILTPSEYGPLKEVTIIEYTYILENHETDDVNTTIQQQFNDQLNTILKDPTTTYTEKEQLHQALLNEYQDYTINYGQPLKSLCESETLCTMESQDIVSPTDILGPLSEDLKALITKVTITMGTILVALLVGYHLLTQLITSLLELLFTLTKALATGITHIIIFPLINGLKLIAETIINILSGGS